MPSKREQVIQAVVALVRAAVPEVDLVRNSGKPEKIGKDPVAIVNDGDPGEPEVTLNPVTYLYEHRIPVAFGANRTRTETADAVMDSILVRLGQAIEANRSLGGLCDYLDVEAPVADVIEAEGAQTARFAEVTLVAAYGVTNPLT
ncbi:hypothetical protein [Enterovirga sp. CN4-39]|uniref:hypothetical protein n=1 Tax=Enterovirga sp. CN4-39 TaxID=3400910 RepID=UPI003C109DB5